MFSKSTGWYQKMADLLIVTCTLYTHTCYQTTELTEPTYEVQWTIWQWVMCMGYKVIHINPKELSIAYPIKSDYKLWDIQEGDR